MTTLYRAYDSADRLLYVGITDREVTQRLAQHRDKPRDIRVYPVDRPNIHWSDHMATVRVTYYPDRTTALAAESAAIREEDPVFNLAGRPRERFMQWILAYPDRHADDITPADIEAHECEADRLATAARDAALRRLYLRDYGTPDTATLAAVTA